VDKIEPEPSAILLRRDDERDRNFRGPKPPSRFDSGRRRSFGDREEFRAREVATTDLADDPEPSSVVPEERMTEAPG
jgi:small subunit ribosomal protein S6